MKLALLQGLLIFLFCQLAYAADDYDPKPFLKGLSSSYKAKTSRKIGVKSLSDLPLYQIDMDLNPILGTIKVHQEVNYKNISQDAISEIVFRTFPNAPHLVQDQKGLSLVLKNLTVQGTPSTAEPIHSTAFRVSFSQPLLPGQRTRIGMDYHLNIPILKKGIDSMGSDISAMLAQLRGNQKPEGYGKFSRRDGVFNLGFFYPIIPARHNKGWDTFLSTGLGDVAHLNVANYLVKLRVPKNMMVASSGIKLGDLPLGPNPSDKKEVYLLGTALRTFAVQLSTRYAVVDKKVGKTNVRYFYIEEQQSKPRVQLNQAAKALRVFEKLFGSYPYPELDIAQAYLKGQAGGIEYPGLVTVAAGLTQKATGKTPMQDLLSALFRETKTTEFVIVHEIAHQWWYSLVGSDSNRHPFLDEALANYTAVLYFEAVYGQSAAAQQIETQLTLPYQAFKMMGGVDGVVNRSVNDFSSQLEYAALVYGKGGYFFHTLRKVFGKKAFLRFLRAYASSYAFKIAQPNDMLRIASRVFAKPKKVKSLYRRWMLETHADQDIKMQDFADLNKLLPALKNLQGIHNIKFDGQIDPAILKMFQDAVKQLSGQ